MKESWDQMIEAGAKPPAVHVGIAKAMSDGRERTAGDLAHKMPGFTEKAIKEGLNQMTTRGLLLVDWFGATGVYRASRKARRHEELSQ